MEQKEFEKTMNDLMDAHDWLLKEVDGNRQQLMVLVRAGVELQRAALTREARMEDK
ncbi:hypothetical protein [Priestia megaterium]|uniref:hypothetical protein n=1 Tax=Priestia megaterium TaxID=1404 RepID=UPI002E2428B2|nr:hypothetical protein [Priestia megaterium]